MNKLHGDFMKPSSSGLNPMKQYSSLDDEKEEELLKPSTVKTGKKIGASEDKTMAAMKSHSEAERRRRDRINAHLATLRELMPYNEKMDKATLLGEVINQVKQLKKTATEACEGLQIPMDSDEVKVETVESKAGSGMIFIRASLCCDYRPDLVSHIRETIDELSLRIIKCEMSTLGGRVKSVILITPGGESTASWEAIVGSIHTAFSNILKNVSASAEYDQQLYFPQKRRRVSSLDSSSS